MKSFFARAFVVAGLLAAFAPPLSAHARAQGPALHHADTTRVLFIGNSYTYVNNLPAVFSAVAAAAGRGRYGCRAGGDAGVALAKRRFGCSP